MANMNAPKARPPYTARPGEPILVFRDGQNIFAIGRGRVTIMASDHVFQFNVVRDLGSLVHMPAGEDVLGEGDRLGLKVRIGKPELPTDPPNAWIVPDDLAAACSAGTALGRGADGGPRHGTGTGCGSTIIYDPADWPRPGDPQSPSSVEVLLRLLRQANQNARGNSDSAKPDWGAGETEP
jgi:hypothetical protein